MHFWRVSTPEPGCQALTAALQRSLADGRNVLWLVSGGSNIAISTAIARNLTAAGSDLTGLQVLLVDERYGPPGHADSNYEQLRQAGFCELLPQTEPVLQPDQSLEATAAAYEQRLARALQQCDVVIGQFGIGADGHTAGILPHSPAADETAQLSVAYRSDPYERITMSFAALRQVQQAFVFAFGDDKAAPLKLLMTTEVPLDQQPAQIFRQLSDVSIYNDQGGEPV